MPVTMEQVRKHLEPIEPDYVEAAMLGEESMPFLDQIASGNDSMLAPRAVHMASLIGGDHAVRIVRKATDSHDPVMRVQAAAVARYLPQEAAEDILLGALDDTDAGVRNFALKTVKVMAAMPAAIQTKVRALAASDPEPFIRGFASDLLRMENPPR